MSRKTRFARSAAVWMLATACLASATAIAAGPAFEESLDAAMRKAADEKKVVVVVFEAPWCSWCRKMRATTLIDPKVGVWADRFIWARVDITEDAQTAAAFGISGVPLVMLMSSRGGVLTSRGGYLAPEAMVKLLSEYADKATATGVAGDLHAAVATMNDSLPRAHSAGDCREAIEPVLAALAAPERMGREWLLAAVSEGGENARRGLLEAMADDRLAVRAAAGGSLAVASGKNLPFDAFAEPDVRARQIAAWREALQLPADATPSTPQPQAPQLAPGGDQ